MISTKNTPKRGGGESPLTLKPGNKWVTVKDIYMKTFTKSGSRRINLFLEELISPDSNFQGLPIPGTNEFYKGPVGTVALSKFPSKDRTTLNGFPVLAEEELQIQIHDLCKELGIMSWYEDQDGLHENMNNFIKAMQVQKPFKDIKFYACIAGSPYVNDNDEMNYDLFFPQSNRNLGKGFSMKQEKVQIFSIDSHVLTRNDVPVNQSNITLEPTFVQKEVNNPVQSNAEISLNNIPVTPEIMEFAHEGIEDFTSLIESDHKLQQANLPLKPEPIIKPEKAGLSENINFLNPDSSEQEKMPWD